MKCENCQGKGFIEYESGIIMVECEACNGTGEIDVYSGTGPDILEGEVEELPKGWEDKGECIGGFLDDSNGGARQLDSNIGSADTSQPKQHRERKAKKKASKGAK